MARRTLTVRTITARPHGSDKIPANFLPLDNMRGFNIATEFASWLRGLGTDDLRDEDKKRYVTKPEVTEVGHLTLATASLGYWGDPGRVTFHSETGERRFITDDSDASTTPLRVAFLVPPGGTTGLFFIEREGMTHIGGLVIARFKAHLRAIRKEMKEAMISSGAKLSKAEKENLRSVTVDDASYTSGQDWLDAAQVLQVEVDVLTSTGVDGDERYKVTAAQQSTTYVPEGPRFFPDWVKELLLSGQIREGLRALNYPVPDDDEGDPQVSLRMEASGRQRTMVVDDPRAPAVSILLNDNGSPRLSDEELLETVTKEAESVYRDLRLTFDSGWLEPDELD